MSDENKEIRVIEVRRIKTSTETGKRHTFEKDNDTWRIRFANAESYTKSELEEALKIMNELV